MHHEKFFYLKTDLVYKLTVLTFAAVEIERWQDKILW